MTQNRIAILGSGPTGLDAALAASMAGWDFTVFESADRVADNVRSWGHVRLFTPWSMNVSPRARARLETVGLSPPDGDVCPTGAELVERVFEPLAALPDIAPHVRLGTRVLDISRGGLLKSDEIGTAARARPPFRLLVRDENGDERVEHATVVLDCTGSYSVPNALGLGGIPAPGERAAEEYIIRRIPDFETPLSTVHGPRWAGERILLVGAGHSAQTVACDLAALVSREPSTRVTWAIRSRAPSFGVLEDDALPERATLALKARDLALDPMSPFDVRLGCAVHALAPGPEGITVELRGDEGLSNDVCVDRILSMTGSVGDARMYRQLQVHECYATSGPMKLASALLATSSVDCLTQESQGVDTLRNPEPDFFILGSKSYGRNTTFLMRVGWEQVEEVFSLLGPAVTAESTNPYQPSTEKA